ncbi:hypothetical protein EKO04_004222 [Ascochyta lentis]|uniref:Uncharacterized protein n=1 Tax=Ascochyta lentis TaxID=205686 RepID=A0A8H7J4E5_9PLEO|nr:hypothetical protein EKO04_004222 [Ascochyta lentis]
MTIFTNTYYKKDLSRTEVQIDLVPLLMMGLVNQKFKCDFKYEPRSREATSLDMDIHTMMAADVNTLQKLLTHRQVDWLRDVISGRVSRLLISHIGTNNYPRARFFIGPVKDNQLLSEFTQHNRKEMKLPSPYPVRSPGMEESRLSLMSPNLKNGYVGHVELRKVFIENDYIFLWDVEWEGAEQEAGASFFLE